MAAASAAAAEAAAAAAAAALEHTSMRAAVEATEQKDVSGLTIAAGHVTCSAQGCEVRNPEPDPLWSGAQAALPQVIRSVTAAGASWANCKTFFF